MDWDERIQFWKHHEQAVAPPEANTITTKECRKIISVLEEEGKEFQWTLSPITANSIAGNELADYLLKQRILHLRSYSYCEITTV